MPSFGDSIFIFFLALLLFGPKKLPELARQLGKLMAEFRRASNEFKYQMEEEFRQIEQAEQKKKLPQEAAAAPATPVEGAKDSYADFYREDLDTPSESSPAPEEEAQPIATSGELSMMPPATGLPVENAAVRTSSGESGDAKELPGSEVPTHG